MNIYWGDLHNHCGITYGFGSLENAIQRARGRLDFCAFTGHAMWPDIYSKTPETEFLVNFHEVGFKKLRDHWEEVRDKVAKANSKELVTFQGYELHSGKYGDHHLVSIDDNLPLVYRDSPKELVEACGKETTIAIPHHIAYTPSYRGINWDYFDSSISPVVEVYSKHGCSINEDAAYPYYHDMGPRDTRNMVDEGLRRGYHFGFVASTDHHAGFPGSYGDGLVAVIAEKKTRESIWEGLRMGRTYAVTGDKILCDFRINDAYQGSAISALVRKLHVNVQTQAPLDKIVIYKNEKPYHILNGENYWEVNQSGHYKIRVEMGWGDQTLYRWNGKIKIEGGSLTDIDTCFRGRNVLSPTQREASKIEQINDIASQAEMLSEKEMQFTCDTVGNQSTLHPCTSAVIVTVEGDLNTKVTVQMNDQSYQATIGELLQYGYTSHMKYYHSQAFKIHKALPESRYIFNIDMEDQLPEKDEDIYRVEVSQKNGQWAYSSPIFVRNI